MKNIVSLVVLIIALTVAPIRAEERQQGGETLRGALAVSYRAGFDAAPAVAEQGGLPAKTARSRGTDGGGGGYRDGLDAIGQESAQGKEQLQDGTGNTARRLSSSPGNSSQQVQAGSFGVADIRQPGERNAAVQVQELGAGNEAFILQAGNEDSAYQYQSGNLNRATITQDAAFNAAYQYQGGGDGNIARITQTADHNLAYQEQSGNSNLATINQASTFNTARQYQRGNGNTATIRQ